MIYTNISKYIEAKNKDQQISARLNKNGIKYFVDGEWTKKAPIIPQYSRACMTNPDKTYII